MAQPGWRGLQEFLFGWLGVGEAVAVEAIALTLNPRSESLTLASRSETLTLNARSESLTLESEVE